MLPCQPGFGDITKPGRHKPPIADHLESNMARLAILIAAIAAIGAGWYTAWNWGADEIDRQAGKAIAGIASQGGRLDCRDRTVAGFPFRIGVSCSAVEFAPPGGGAVSASSFRSAAQFYDPGKVVGEMDGPALIQLPDGRRFELNWEVLRSSLRANLDSINALSVELRQPVLSEGRDTAGEQVLARSDEAQFHARRSPQDNNALDIALSAQALRDDQERFPGFSLAVEARLDAIADKIAAGGNPLAILRREGLSGEASKVEIAPSEGGRLTLSGPFTVAPDGLLDGEITVTAERIAALGAFFTALAPGEAEMIGNVAGLLSSLETGSSGEGAGKTASIKLTIVRGNVSLGLIPVGELPPLF